MKKLLILVAMFFLLGACATTNVKPIDQKYHNIDHICIKENFRVAVTDFLDVVQNCLKDHNISSSVFIDTAQPHCEYFLHYIAWQTWDLATYMHHAELWLYKGEEEIGYGEYKLIGKGGFSLLKWDSVEFKIKPVIHEMLTGEKIKSEREIPKE